MGVITSAAKLFLCLLFILSGVCKLTPKGSAVGEDVYSSMDAAFRERLTPFWEQSLYLSSFGVQLDPGVVKLFFGSTEILSAVMLYTPFKFFGSILLFGLMSALTLTHVFLGDFAEVPMPLVLCIASLGVCFLDAMPPALSGKPKTS